MPFINVQVIEGVFTPDQKHAIVERLTDAMVAVEGEAMRGVTWVVVEDVGSGDRGHRRDVPHDGGRQGAGRLVRRLTGRAAVRVSPGTAARRAPSPCVRRQRPRIGGGGR